MFNIRKFFQGIGLIPVSTTAVDTKGEMEVLDASGKLNYHDGTTASPMVTEAHASTLTNKTIVVASNTVTTAASGNLTATELNAALAELQTDIDTKASDAALTAHIDDTTDAHDASAISNTPAGNLAATDVQGALNELQSDVDTRALDSALTAHIDDTTDAHDASAISNTPSGNLAATDVQGALNEIQSDVDSRATASDLSNHISDTSTHGVTGDIVGTTDAQTLSNKTMADALTFTEITTPSTPGTGLQRIYPKADGKFYRIDDAGIETELGAGSGGNVVGPASATDNAIARFDTTTGELIQNSVVTIDDSGVISGAELPATDVSFTPDDVDNWPLGAPSPATVQQALDDIARTPTAINLLTNWQAYSITIGASTTPPTKGTTSVDQARYRRVGDSVEIVYTLRTTSSGTAGSGTYLIPLPAGLVADTTNISAGTVAATNDSNLGTAVIYTDSGGTPQEDIGYASLYNTTNIAIRMTAGALGSNYYWGSANRDLSRTSVGLKMRAVVPIAAWGQATNADIFEAGDFGWTEFTPSFTNQPTINSSSFFYRRVGDSMDIMGYASFGSGGSGSTLQLALPDSKMIRADAVPARRTLGDLNFNYNNASEFKVIGIGGNSYLTFAAQAQTGGVTADTAGSSMASSDVFIQANGIPIDGWSTFPIGVATQAGPWIPYTATFGGGGSVSSQNLKYQMIGNNLMNIRGLVTLGGSSASAATMSLPSGKTIDASVVDNSNYESFGDLSLGFNSTYYVRVIGRGGDSVFSFGRQDGSFSSLTPAAWNTISGPFSVDIKLIPVE